MQWFGVNNWSNKSDLWAPEFHLFSVADRKLGRPSKSTDKCALGRWQIRSTNAHQLIKDENRNLHRWKLDLDLHRRLFCFCWPTRNGIQVFCWMTSAGLQHFNGKAKRNEIKDQDDHAGSGTRSENQVQNEFNHNQQVLENSRKRIGKQTLHSLRDVHFSMNRRLSLSGLQNKASSKQQAYNNERLRQRIFTNFFLPFRADLSSRIHTFKCRLCHQNFF